MSEPRSFPHGWPRVQGRCPACKHSALFIGEGGYVTCGNLSCTNPCAATDLLETTPPEFPLPIRPDGSHAYTSTYCAHGDHAACRLRCKTCAAECACPCGHPAPEPSCPYDHDELTRGWGDGTPCRCQPHHAGQAPGCPEGCPTHNHGGEDVPEGVIGGAATDEDLIDGDRCPTCGCVVGPDCEACERDCQQGGTDDTCRIVEVDGGPDLTREELQGLVDEQGLDLYQARDLLDFIREMCDQHDAAGTPITTGDVRQWLRYTGCGGVLVLPDEVVAKLAILQATALPTQATGEDEPDDGSGFRCPYCSGPTTYQAFSGGREWCCPACEETGEYPADQTPVRAALLRTQDGRAELRRQMAEHSDGLRKGGQP